MRKLPFLLLFALALWTPQGAAATTVIIDFESLAHAGTATTPPQPYDEDGFRLTADTGFAVWGTASPHHAGSAALYNDYPDEFTELTRIGGGTFSPVSIDLAELFDDSLSVSVTFVGTLPDTSTVLQTFTLDALHDGTTASFETFFFDASFQGIESLRWQQESEFHQFDNVVIPEPSSLGLALLGLAGLARPRRR